MGRTPPPINYTQRHFLRDNYDPTRRLQLDTTHTRTPRRAPMSWKTKMRRAQRASSNVFAMFDQAQIAEFKEAFTMIDQDRDGFITKEDLHDMLASLGHEPTDEQLSGMMAEAPGESINFTMFLTLFGEKMSGTDPDMVINNAFTTFDDVGKGEIPTDKLREILGTMGDRLTDEELDEMFHAGKACDDGTNFNYLQFTKLIKGQTEHEKEHPAVTA